MKKKKNVQSSNNNVVPLKGDAESIAKALGKGKERKGNDGWFSTICPAHNDKSPSLGIKDGLNGPIFRCHAGCPSRDVRTQLIELGFLRDTTKRTRTRFPKSRKFCEFPYHDSKGNPVMMVKRIDEPDGGKTFRQYRPDGDGGWIAGIADHVTNPPPYNLPMVLKAINKGMPVYIVEGEKAVECLRANNLVATTNSGGAGKWREHHSDYLVGADVVILPDNDEPGRNHADDAARFLEGKAKQVKVVHLPDLPEKGDVVDYFGRGGTREDLKRWAEETPIWEDVVDENSPLIRQISSVVTNATDFKKAKIQKPNTLLEPWLTEGSLSMIYAERGIGKTWLGLIIATILTRKTDEPLSIGPWEAINKCGTLYIDGEMSEYELQKRIKRLTKIFRKESPDHPFGLLHTSRFLPVFGKQINIAKPEWRDAISEYILANPQYRHIILDNLASLTSGLNEDKQKDWGPINQWLISLRSLGIAVTQIHHAGKGGFQRGTSGREDSLDNIIKLSKPSTYRSGIDGAYFNIAFEKNRNAAPGDNTQMFSLRIIDNPLRKHSLVWEEGPYSDSRDTKKDPIMCDLIRKELNNKQIASKHNVTPSRVSQIKKEAKQQNYIDHRGHSTPEGQEFLDRTESILPPTDC